MTRDALFAPLLAALLAATPVAAQEMPREERGGEMGEGLDLLGQGMRKLFEGLGDELEPAMRDFAQAAQPVIARLMELIDNIDAYELPEKLPNGDIIIRRKPSAPEPDSDPDGNIEI